MANQDPKAQLSNDRAQLSKDGAQLSNGPVTSTGRHPIAITDKAIAMAKQRLEAAQRESSEPILGLRLGVRGGGCSGFFYVFDVATKLRARDRTYDFDGLTVVMDDRSLEYLRGSTLEWQTKLMGYGFHWKNPRAKSLCGCGESFTIEP